MSASNRDFFFFLALAAGLHAAVLLWSRIDLQAVPAPAVLRLRLAPPAPIPAAREHAVARPATPQAAPSPPPSPAPSARAEPPERAEGETRARQAAPERPAARSVPSPVSEPVGEKAVESETATAQLEARASYEQLLAAWLDKHKYYPSVLRRRGIEGDGVLHVRLGRDGSVVAVESAEGFDNAMLETVARDWIARSDPFPPVPEDLTGPYYLVRFPVRFRLQ